MKNNHTESCACITCEWSKKTWKGGYSSGEYTKFYKLFQADVCDICGERVGLHGSGVGSCYISRVSYFVNRNSIKWRIENDV